MIKSLPYSLSKCITRTREQYPDNEEIQGALNVLTDEIAHTLFLAKMLEGRDGKDEFVAEAGYYHFKD